MMFRNEPSILYSIDKDGGQIAPARFIAEHQYNSYVQYGAYSHEIGCNTMEWITTKI